MMKAFDYLLERLKEPSTIRALIVSLGLLGVKISPELTESIIESVVSLLITFEILRKEKV